MREAHMKNNEPNYTPGFRAYNQPDSGRKFKSLDEIVCFKCGEQGHFANKCPKGHLAFLSNPASSGGQG